MPNCKDSCSTYYEGISREPQEITKEQEKEIARKYNLEQKQRYYERNYKKNMRMGNGCLDQDNAQKYFARAGQYKKKLIELCENNPDVLRLDKARLSLRGILSVDNVGKITITDVNQLNAELKEAIREYTAGKFDDICEYSQYIISDGKGVVSKKYGKEMLADEWKEKRLNEISDKTKRQTKEIIEVIESQQVKDDKLYRIEMGVNDAKEGDVIDFGIRSTSRDKDFVDRVFSGEDQGLNFYADGNFTEYRFMNSKSFDISSISEFQGDEWYKGQEESLVYGNYKVVKTEMIKNVAKHEEVIEIPFKDYLKNNGIEVESFTAKSGTEMVKYIEDGKIKTLPQNQFDKKVHTYYKTVPAQYGRKVVYLEYVNDKK